MEAQACREDTELRLGLPGTDGPATKGTKRAIPPEMDDAGEPPSAVVGWPPVRSFWKNSLHVRKKPVGENCGGTLVKVSMDGAPYLRKIDLRVYNGYEDLKLGLEGMFKCFILGEYVMAFEDKDGDLMMVGDVPWNMFIASCRRLRVMRGCGATGSH
ncbi:Auxin-induced protein 22D [Platanthera zijinensis]|uniref:Auxin-responsive protein n=1 Tax=Platanthera zijinensis TaxID=2320716 RepID=A0AAP0BTL6_9ASPA